MTTYATLAQGKDELKAPNTPDAIEDPKLLRALYFVTRRIDAMKNMTFAPRNEARSFDAFGDHIDCESERLYLDFPLLALTSISINGVALSGSTYVLEGRTPYRVIRRVSGSWASIDGFGSIVITGIWGYRERYTEEGWLQVSTLTAGINATVTSCGVDAAAGADPYGRVPRFSPGALLRIDSEYLELTAVSTNTLTVRRGVRGSTAATHDNAAPVFVWYPDDAIVRAATRWCSYLYARRGAFETTKYDGIATTEFPADAPQEITNILAVIPSWGGYGAP